jgi:hypothetical protein
MAMKNKLSRRAVLRGAGGVALGLPLLEMTAGKANAQLQGPKRLIIMSVGHSVQVSRAGESWLPGGDFAQLSPVLSPLIPQRDRLLLLSGIDNWLSVSGVIPSNGHNLPSRTLLTCAPTKESLDSSGALLASPPSCTYASLPSGPSLDFFLANAWKEDLLNLRVGQGASEHTRSFRMDLTVDHGINNPATAFDRIFKPKQTGVPTTPEDRLRSKRKSILDAVRVNFDRVVAKAGTDDRARLLRHADHIREFELGLDRMVRITCESPKLNLPAPLPPQAKLDFYDGTYDDLTAAGQIDLAVTAFACQATRVAHIHFTNYGSATYPFINNGMSLTPEGWHAIVHIDKGTDDQRLRPMQWHMKVFGDLLDRLAMTPDGTGTLLDNTLAIWISPLRGAAHTGLDLPIVMAGLKGKIRPGRVKSYAPARTLGDYWTTVLNVLDVPATSFGWNKGAAKGRPFQTGPLDGWG